MKVRIGRSKLILKLKKMKEHEPGPGIEIRFSSEKKRLRIFNDGKLVYDASGACEVEKYRRIVINNLKIEIKDGKVQI